jgi:hypothetical protein
VTAQHLLHTHLACAVPLRIQELRDQPEWALDQIRATLPERLQQGADAMQFGGGAPGEAALTVGAWTTALALLALQADGGVDFAGHHWCATPNCRAANRYDHADGEDDGTEPDKPPRPIHDLPDIATWPPPAA